MPDSSAASVLMQPFPALDDATEAALRASISRFGVLVPVVRDQDGRILDGHHRSRLASELGVECPEQMREVADENEAREIARTLNEDRRQLPREQRREIVIALREDGHSTPAIARALGAGQSTVGRDVAELTQAGKLKQPERIIGLDGKSRPSQQTQPSREHQPESGRRGFRKNRDQPFEIKAERHAQVAGAHRERIIDGLSEIKGICTGLCQIDWGIAAAAPWKDGEAAVFAGIAAALAKELGAINRKLSEVNRNGG